MTGERAPILDYAKPASEAWFLTTSQLAAGALFVIALVSAYSTNVLVQPHGWTPEYDSYMAAEVAQRQVQPSYVPSKFTGRMLATESIWKQYTTYIAISATAVGFGTLTLARRRTGSAG